MTTREDLISALEDGGWLDSEANRLIDALLAEHNGETTQPAIGTCDCMDTGPHPKLTCGHCAMDVCEDCKTCAACPHTCDEGGC